MSQDELRQWIREFLYNPALGWSNSKLAFARFLGIDLHGLKSKIRQGRTQAWIFRGEQIRFSRQIRRLLSGEMEPRCVGHTSYPWRQAVDILREIEPLTGRGRYVFPSPRTVLRPLSDNAITAALRRIGHTGEEMSWHGFRAMASTLLNEHGFPPDIIELQLPHQERNEVRAAYNRALRLDERRKMMQA